MVTPPPVKVSTVVAGASGVKLSFAPEPSLGFWTDGEGALQLVDGSGNPVIARSDVAVTVTASNTTILPSPLSLTVPAGSNYVAFPLLVHEPGTTTLSATSQGLLSSSSSVEVIRAPLRVSISANPVAPNEGESVTLTVVVSVDGVPVPDTVVHWASSSGSVTPQSDETSPSGVAQASFVSQSSGKATVTASVTVSGVGALATTYDLTVSSSSSSTSIFSGELPILALGAAVVVLAIADLVYLRRKRGRKKSILSDLEQAS